MLSKKIKNTPETKLSKTLNDFENNNIIEKTGFIQSTKKSSLFKTKSFRLRESDIANFTHIVSHINSLEDRMEYSDSQVIRGLINFVSNNIEINKKKLISYIRNSS